MKEEAFPHFRSQNYIKQISQPSNTYISLIGSTCSNLSQPLGTELHIHTHIYNSYYNFKISLLLVLCYMFQLYICHHPAIHSLC